MLSDLSQTWWILAASAVATAGLCLALIPLARSVGLVDHPGTRKVHQVVTPLTGGPAIFVVLALITFFTLPMDRFVNALGLGSLILAITGMLDDRQHLSAAVRFLVQIAACLIMVFWAGIYLEDFGSLMWDGVFSLGGLAVPVTLFAALGVINAFNMIDGMDGLAGGIFLVATTGMCYFAYWGGQTDVLWLLLVLIACTLGFLMVNGRSPWGGKALVFLGNTGSLFLGFVLAWFFIVLGSGEERSFAPMTAVWLFAVPLLDTTTLIWRRWKAGNSVFLADQYHIHHAFLRAGFSVTVTWWCIILLAVFFAGVGILIERFNVPEFVGFYAFMGFAFIYYFYMRKSWQQQKFLGRDFVYGEFDVEAGVT